MKNHRFVKRSTKNEAPENEKNENASAEMAYTGDTWPNTTCARSATLDKAAVAHEMLEGGYARPPEKRKLASPAVLLKPAPVETTAW